MDGLTATEQAEAMQEFQLEEIERRAADLTHRWMNRVVWELDAAGTANLNETTAEFVDQASRVLDLLERVQDNVERLREVME